MTHSRLGFPSWEDPAGILPQRREVQPCFPLSTEKRDLLVLADADSFYASCEASMDPTLAHKPVVVLSNNDGCVVTRNRLAKSLGIENGTPWFKLRDFAHAHGVVARSSNYELYGSLSARMMSVMDEWLPNQMPYSIDECFFRIHDSPAHAFETARRMRKAVMQGVGLPVSIGISPTKTMCKAVNDYVKHHPEYGPVGCWEQYDMESLFSGMPAGDVWGVGRRGERRLLALGVLTARDLSHADEVEARHLFGTPLARTILELRGVDAVPDETGSPVRKDQIMCTRMFGRGLEDPDEIAAGVSVFAQQAAARLRRQGSLCQAGMVFASTSPFTVLHGVSRLAVPLSFGTATDQPARIAGACAQAIRERLDPSCRYVRAGVLLTGLVPKDSWQPLELFEPARDEGLGDVLDQVNRRFGAASIGIGHAGIRGRGRLDRQATGPWDMRRQRLSPRATTRWDEMLRVKAN